MRSRRSVYKAADTKYTRGSACQAASTPTRLDDVAQLFHKNRTWPTEAEKTSHSGAADAQKSLSTPYNGQLVRG